MSGKKTSIRKGGGVMRTSDTPLAIVGMASRFPKANNLEEYWANIKNGVDAITAVPETHWRIEDYFSEDQKKPDFTYGQRGGFLDPIEFDPIKYGIPPNSIEAIDTSQLLGMVVADEAMRDAGYGPDREFDRDKVSVILGVTGALELVVSLGARLGHPHWRKALQDAGVDPQTTEEVVERISDSYVSWQENSFPGLLGNVVAGRISKHLNTGGTNCVVDAACASSLSAVHLAAMELVAGKSDMVIAGGVDTFNDIFMYMCFSKTPALSPSGDARPFDAHGDGTTLGEGLGFVVLKRLEDAQRDGDRVYAVLRGIGSSSDGKGDAIYAPSSPGQVKALRAAYRDADVEPNSIGLVEAHGTGTSKGDAVEASALREVYGDGDGGAWCALGSVKSQIGHTKSAAGAAGLIKAAMALYNKVLPPTIKVDMPLDEVAPGASAFYVNTRQRPWIHEGTNPRRAGISAFGFGGSNFHVVLEEYTPSKLQCDWDGRVQTFTLSASRPDELKRAVDNLPVDGTWDEIRAAAQKSRMHFKTSDAHRILFVVQRDSTDFAKLVKSAAELLKRPNDAASSVLSSPDGVYYGAGACQGKLAFVFPGQGAQYAGMLRDLACQFPEMLETLEAAESVLRQDEPDFRLSDCVYPHSTFDNASAKVTQEALRATDVAQPAIGAVSIGALRVLARFDVKAEAAAGHSYGELTALCAAGRLGVEDFFRLSRLRGQLMAKGEGDKGSMLAIRATVEQVEEILARDSLELVIANKNSPDQCVLSGRSDEIARAAEVFSKEGVVSKQLDVAAAFHSALVSGASAPLLEALDSVSFSEGAYPVYSNTSGETYPEDADEARHLLAYQLSNPVEFVKEIEALYKVGVRTFLEVGPGARLTGLVKSILQERPHEICAVDASKGNRSGIADLAKALAQLAAAGHRVDWAKWDEDFTAPIAENGRPRFTVSISGANHRGPRPERRYAPKPVASPTPAPSAPATPASATPANHAPQAPVNVPPLPPSGNANELFRQTQENILALQRIQEQTARLHGQFLAGQEKAAKSFQTLLQQQQVTFAQGSPSVAPVPGPRTPAPVPVPVDPVDVVDLVEASVEGAPELAKALLAVVAEKTGYPTDMLELSMELDGDLGIDSIKRVEILSALQERFPALPSIAADELGAIRTLSDIVDHLDGLEQADVAPAAAGLDEGTVTRILLNVVAEKTGYPPEMLELDMQLDADLGIDSIKRVEILSAMQEQLAGLPSVEAGDLGALQSLREVVNYLMDSAPKETVVADFSKLLLEVVSDKTGYPAEMLELDMQLDADLGIDSIKRVEILSAMQEAHPELPSVEAEALGSLQTLRDVLDHLTAQGPTRKSAEPAAASNNETPHEEVALGPVKRSVLRVKSGAAQRRTEPLLGAGAKLVVTGGELAVPLVEALQRQGFEAQCVALDKVPEFPGLAGLQGLIVVAPFAEADDGFLKSAFRAVQSVGSVRSVGSGLTLLATISRMDGSFGLSGLSDEARALTGGLAGLTKTASHEWPEVTCRAFDLADDFESSEEAVDAIVDAALYSDCVELGISSAGWNTLGLETESIERGDISERLDADSVVVVSGGARGVTAETAVALARESKATFVLLGRSAAPHAEEEWLCEAPDEAAMKQALASQLGSAASPKELEGVYRAASANREMLSTLKRLEDAGAKAVYRSVDIRDAQAVGDVLDVAREEFGPISAVIHGAGVLADRRIEDKTPEQFDAVYDTKVLGLRALLRATANDPLKLVALFSSSTARFGRSGQVDYAVANEVLNKLAHVIAKKRHECRVVSVNWGPWAGGMVTTALRKIFEAEGVGLVSLEGGAGFFLREISQPGDAAIEVVAIGQLPGAITTEAETLSRVLNFDLNVSDYPFLRSHVIDGKAVLPMSMYVEWFAHAALHANPGYRFSGITGLKVFKGVILNETDVQPLEICAGKSVKYGDDQVVSLELRGENKAGPYHLYARADVSLASRPHSSAAAGPRKPSVSPEELSLKTYSKLHEEIYDNGLLFHGAQFQGIHEVEGCSEKGIVATATTASRPGQWLSHPMRKSWLADPLVLDCAFQMMILWSFETYGVGSLPVSLGRYQQFQTSFPKGRIRIVARINETDDHKAIADIEFINPKNGKLVARIDQYECVIDESLNAAFQRNLLVSV